MTNEIFIVSRIESIQDHPNGGNQEPVRETFRIGFYGQALPEPSFRFVSVQDGMLWIETDNPTLAAQFKMGKLHHFSISEGEERE
jgi:hypothetical protein